MKTRKENGSIEVAVAIFIVFLITLMTLFFGYLSHKETELMDRWSRECVSQNGIVGRVSSYGYECYIDGKITTLPGYEQYSTVIKN